MPRHARCARRPPCSPPPTGRSRRIEGRLVSPVQRAHGHHVAGPPRRHVALGERIDAPEPLRVMEGTQGLVAHQLRERGEELLATTVRRRGQEGPEPVRRRQRGQDAVALDPDGRPDPFRGGPGDRPERRRVGGHRLGGKRTALAMQRLQALCRHAAHGNVAQRAHRQRADHRVGGHALAAGQADRAAAGGDVDRLDHTAEANALAQLIGHPQRHRRRALGHPSVSQRVSS
jgi:hypothetical protein